MEYSAYIAHRVENDSFIQYLFLWLIAPGRITGWRLEVEARVVKCGLTGKEEKEVILLVCLIVIQSHKQDFARLRAKKASSRFLGLFAFFSVSSGSYGDYKRNSPNRNDRQQAYSIE